MPGESDVKTGCLEYMERTHPVGKNLMEKGDSLFFLTCLSSLCSPIPPTLWLDSWCWHLPWEYTKFQFDTSHLTVRAKIKFTLSKHLKYPAKVSCEAQLFEFWLMFMITNKLASSWSVNLKLSISIYSSQTLFRILTIRNVSWGGRPGWWGGWKPHGKKKAEGLQLLS